MSHAVMVLKAKGPQDIATIVQPDITFWRSVFLRHTNFTWEDTDIAQATGSVDYGQTVEFKLPRSGDLVTRCLLALQFDPLTLGTITRNTTAVSTNANTVTATTTDTEFPFSPYIWDFGRALIDYVELTIGGYQIERITGDMLHVWDRLSRPDSKSWVDNLSVHHGQSVKIDEKGNVVAYTNGKAKQYVYIPLDFTFTQHPGLSLPMIAMQYHEVRVKVKFQTADKMFAKNAYLGRGARGTATYDTLSYEIRPDIRRMLQEGKWGKALTQIVHTMGNRKIIDWLIANIEYFDQTNVSIADYVASITIKALIPSSGTNSTTASKTSTFTADLGTEYAAYAGTSFVFGDIGDLYLKRIEPYSILSNYSTWVSSPPKFSAKLLCRYVYLDDFERRQFAVNQHEYLVTELQYHQQFVDGNQESVSIDLKFNHPTKELVFFYRPDNWVDAGYPNPVHVYKGYWEFMNWKRVFKTVNGVTTLYDPKGHLFDKANLTINSQTVYGDGRDANYFSAVVPSQFHTRVPKDQNIYVVPFSLDPENWKPSGSLNFSRLDDVKLTLSGMNKPPPGSIHVYARNFNVLTVSNGMAGKRYAS